MLPEDPGFCLDRELFTDWGSPGSSKGNKTYHPNNFLEFFNYST